MSIRIIDENRESLNRLVLMLEKENITLHRPFEACKPKPPSQKSQTDGGMEGAILGAVTSAVVVEVTKEAVKTVVKWLQERKNRPLKNPRLQLVIKGNTFELGEEDIENLASVLNGFVKRGK